MKKIFVNEMFTSLQGEGYNVGKPAFFLRLAGCNNACDFCDSKESWATGTEMQIKDIVAEVKKSKLNNVVITGGEPLLQNLDRLCGRLYGNTIWLETSGVGKLSGTFDWVCLSPKPHCPPTTRKIYLRAHELKIIISSEEDFIFAEKEASKVNGYCKLFLQAEWSKAETLNPIIVSYILNNPQWRLSIQTHKFLHFQ